MRILVYCAERYADGGAEGEGGDYEEALKKALGPGVELTLAPLESAGRGKAKASQRMSYFDADAADLERILALGAKAAVRGPWGVVDRSGRVADPAQLFHAGASDYLGPALLKKGKPLTVERLDRAAAFSRGADSDADGAGTAGCRGGAPEPGPAFPGWDKLAVETCYPFTFFYAAVADQQGMLARLGDKRMDKLRADFSAFISAWAEERGGKLWIRDAASNLVLFPAFSGSAGAGSGGPENPALCAFRLLLDRLLIGYEHFRLEVPVSFRFAVHSGDAPWRLPGRTGTVVSEHVNFIYHFGMKAVADGTLGVSETAASLIAPSFAELFAEGKPFEGRRVWYSRRIR